jgi:hypothetical protein
MFHRHKFLHKTEYTNSFAEEKPLSKLVAFISSSMQQQTAGSLATKL